MTDFVRFRPVANSGRLGFQGFGDWRLECKHLSELIGSTNNLGRQTFSLSKETAGFPFL
jgi:hypothetical protein